MNFNPLTQWVSGEVTSIPFETGGTAYNAGDIILVGELLCFALADIPANSNTNGHGSLVAGGGFWKGAKAAGGWTAGNPVYWDSAATPNVTPSSSVSGAFTQTISATATFVGIATVTPGTTAAALTGDQYGYFIKVNSVSGEFGATVAAAGTNQATAAALLPGFNFVTGAAGSGANPSVILPAGALPGTMVLVKNSDAANAILPVYPPTGGTINALSANSALNMAVKTSCILVALNATTWYSIPLLPS